MKQLDRSLSSFVPDNRVDLANICRDKKCKLTRLQCCEKRGLDIKDDKKIMDSQEMRYASMVQTIKDNSHGINLFQKFGSFQ